MYESFFELQGRPFPSTPDTSAYFPTASHEEALALLKCAMNDGESISVLLAGPGMGKTLLCHQLLESVDPRHALVFLNNLNNPSVESLLQGILHDLSLDFTQASEQTLRLQLSDFLIERFSQGSKTILFIDEAQNLSRAQLEELRLLTNLEGRSGRAIQILLVGQESLGKTLEDESLEAFRARVAVVARLRPLSDEETMEYVRAHIARVKGSADSIFTATALSEICEYAAGIPRRINQICHRALTLAFAHECGTLDGEYVHMAASQLFLVKGADRVESHHLPLLGTPRRLFEDRAFEAKPVRKEKPAGDRMDLHEPIELERATVVELAPDEPWNEANPLTTTGMPSGSFEVGASWNAHPAEEANPSPAHPATGDPRRSPAPSMGTTKRKTLYGRS